MKLLYRYNKKHEKNKKSKKAVSLLVTYVLLILLTVSLAVTIYNVIKSKSKIPERIECPEGVSLYVYNFTCKQLNGGAFFNITLKNNGLFNVDGVNLKVYRRLDLKPCSFNEIRIQINVSQVKSVIMSQGNCAGSPEKLEVLPYRLEKMKKGASKNRKKIYCSDSLMRVKVSC